MDQRDLKAATDGYLVCLLWVMPGTDECENPGDSLSIHCDLGEGVRAEAEKVVAEFAATCGPLADEAVERYGAERFGHDLALTCNGHGAGFWDRDELGADDLGDRLSDLCRHTEQNLYVGDDGKAYLE